MRAVVVRCRTSISALAENERLAHRPGRFVFEEEPGHSQVRVYLGSKASKEAGAQAKIFDPSEI